MKLLLAAILLTNLCVAASGGAGHPKSVTLSTTASTKLGPNYGETNGTLFTTLQGVDNFAVYNGSSLVSVAVTFPLGGDTCAAGAADNFTTKEFVIPPSTGFTPPKSVAINKYACVRSKSGSSLVTGDIHMTVW